MESKLEFVLKPVSGAAEAGGGYRAYLTTAKGAALDSDDVIAEALDRGYIAGVKDKLAKSVVLGVLDSMIDGVLRDGVTRRIGEYLSVSLKIHGRFEDKDDDFDPAAAQVSAFREAAGRVPPVVQGRFGDERRPQAPVPHILRAFRRRGREEQAPRRRARIRHKGLGLPPGRQGLRRVDQRPRQKEHRLNQQADDTLRDGRRDTLRLAG